ncbi:sensor histidine kinase [Ferribacterium limneticum]|uniref:sensor histidine kinase n=1 Tax=Ferribacterium limneticum TaxID=76259 RepID=UPI001CF8FED9|nr:cache domain-containing protein [Ferribacterium limneticum]UCV26888.1 cache domain-containing protein [Ferribacterium limneticum]UCV30805.1 cache domain-containing protein [Ferribacterium limneticum]
MSGLGSLTTPDRRSIRTRLLLLALVPLGVVLPLIMLALAYWGGNYFDQLLVTKVRSDLAVAHGYFERVAEGVGRSVTSLADSERLARALGREKKNDTQRSAANVAKLLGLTQLEQKLDFLHFLDIERSQQDGRVWPVIAAALDGKAGTATEVFSTEQLGAINPALAARAKTPLLPTTNARPDEREVETRGLVVHSAAPVYDAGGRLIGVLEGGVLLNKNLDFIDQMNAIVYPEGALPFGSAGTATLFLDDVRVATNVRLFGDTRAIGTRVSVVVHDTVIGQGRTWLDRAFVVSDWYVSAYEPLLDGQQRRIGMLYVGFLEGPFKAARLQAFAAVAGLFVLAMLIAGAFAVMSARRVFKPIERMHTTMHAIEHGNPDARVGNVESQDELGEVAAHFDRLLDQLQAQADSLKRWGASLDAKVAERTAELQQAVADLKAAQSQLVMNEKLAAIGQLTAGVAHEINNPIAVIQGNLDVLRDVLGPQAEPVAKEIKLIHDQVQRVRLIVAKLLQFARPQDYVGYLEPVETGQLIQDCLLLVRHLLNKGDIAIEQHIDSTRQILCNKNELQQVIINLFVNAIQAMPEGGVLKIAIEDWDQADMPLGIRLIVTDSGPGISDADLAQLFKPFFTAKKPGGNGLGLWVSQALVERYGGKISAESGREQGASFTVWLRLEPQGL